MKEFVSGSEAFKPLKSGSSVNWNPVSMYAGSLVQCKLISKDDKSAVMRVVVVRPWITLTKNSIKLDFNCAAQEFKTYDKEIVESISFYDDKALADLSQFLVRAENLPYKFIEWVKAMSVEQLLKGAGNNSSYHMLQKEVMSVYLAQGIQYQDHYKLVKEGYNNGLKSMEGREQKLEDVESKVRQLVNLSLDSALEDGRLTFIADQLSLTGANMDYMMHTVKCVYEG
jgi:hypothetical protein